MRIARFSVPEQNALFLGRFNSEIKKLGNTSHSVLCADLSVQGINAFSNQVVLRK
jgi:hypothetical protein